MMFPSLPPQKVVNLSTVNRKKKINSLLSFVRESYQDRQKQKIKTPLLKKKLKIANSINPCTTLSSSTRKKNR